MQKEKPHPLLLIVFLLGISAVISGWETLALQRPASAAAPAATNRFEVVRDQPKAVAKALDLSERLKDHGAQR